MYQIVLTGGIGSGKSAVAQILAHRGASVIDYDELAREVVQLGEPALEEIEQHWGAAVLNADGTLNRLALADEVFSDPKELAVLNEITHPRVWALAAKRATELMNSNPAGVLVHDLPLIDPDSASAALRDHCDLVLVVEAPEEMRIDRLASTRGMTVEEARARIANQPSDDERRKMADVVIRNDGSLSDLKRRVNKLWDERIGDWE
ncbi:MAG: dephospho-CoA kinase [Actinomycetaceae bacterium]|nr:dephospho-CoA kinase [Arcanobacterium sp.]MDD7686513.1 dephospho-CoA kinase [Actinomycetaceae bacterium]MDY5272793.1 dephospho-CoA kinase [Arcanobacterium sp.]